MPIPPYLPNQQNSRSFSARWEMQIQQKSWTGFYISLWSSETRYGFAWTFLYREHLSTWQQRTWISIILVHTKRKQPTKIILKKYPQTRPQIVVTWNQNSDSIVKVVKKFPSKWNTTNAWLAFVGWNSARLYEKQEKWWLVRFEKLFQFEKKWSTVIRVAKAEFCKVHGVASLKQIFSEC